MRQIYFNHSLLLDASFSLVDALLIELIQCKEQLKIPLHVHENFWNLSLQSGTLLEYLRKVSKRTLAKPVILALINNGPHYHEHDSIPGLTIVPQVGKSTFGERLLHICYSDNQEYILSLSGEQVLTSLTYKLSTPECKFDVFNFPGKLSLLRKLEESPEFASIDEAFEQIDDSRPAITILSSARKSSRKHNFKGSLKDVYRAIIALESELDLVLQGLPETKRKELYLQKTGFEISGESSWVRDNPKYRAFREFVPEGKGKVFFEWHIKIGNETRIHYFLDKEEKKIIIGHCGKHLPVPSYRS
ncbi:MAG: hypothetical protein GY757_46515 [bacterium]|nr:hypothetical protein [bacterium]